MSIAPRLLKGGLLDDIPPLLSLLKEQYDFILILAPLEENPISPIVLPEVDKALLVSWDQTPELTAPVFSAYRANLGAHQNDLMTIHLQDPASISAELADFRIP